MLLPSRKFSSSFISFYICSFRNAVYVFKFRNMCAEEGYVTVQIQAITVLSRIQLQFLCSKLRLSGAVTSDGMIIGRVNKAIDWHCHSALRLQLCKAVMHFAEGLGFTVVLRNGMSSDILPSWYWGLKYSNFIRKHDEYTQN